MGSGGSGETAFFSQILACCETTDSVTTFGSPPLAALQSPNYWTATSWLKCHEKISEAGSKGPALQLQLLQLEGDKRYQARRQED